MLNKIPINWEIAGNPVNWAIVVLMLAIAGLALSLIFGGKVSIPTDDNG